MEGENSTEPEEVPESVKEVRPLANEFHAELINYFPESRVFVSTEGEIAVHHSTDQESGDGLMAEIHRIADLYADVAGDHDPVTLTIAVDEIQVVVPEPSVEAHVNGDINQEAYHETIEVIGNGE